jgi:hypothetical protein
MYIMTVRGWQMLRPQCRNEIWQQVSWDRYEKRWVPDRNGSLQCVGYRTELPSVLEERREAGNFGL